MFSLNFYFTFFCTDDEAALTSSSGKEMMMENLLWSQSTAAIY